MREKLFATILCAALLITLLPATALAYDYGGATYNDNDFGKLQSFLNLTSDDGTHTNGQRLNSAYNQDDPTTWWGLNWSDSTSDKRPTALLWGDSGLKGGLDISGFTSLTLVNIKNDPISSLELSGDNSLGHLDCRNTGITDLDASGLTGLGSIYCGDITYHSDRLTSVDVSACTSLEFVGASDSAISTLDVSGCTALETLSINDDNLKSLDLSGLESLQTIYCQENPELAALNVKGDSNINYIDCHDCALPALDADGLTKLTYLNCNKNKIDTLGLEGDTALGELDCGSNKLDSLSVEGFSDLTTLDCSNNNLTSIGGLNDSALESLTCSSNAIGELDVSGMTSLGMLACDNNKLTSLDVSGMTSLSMLECDHNQLASLDLSGDTALYAVVCGDNKISSLDTSGDDILTYLLCGNNLIKTLDLSGNTALQVLDTTGNKLTSVKAVLLGKTVSLTAKGAGYVELYRYEDGYYANAVPLSGETFIKWTKPGSKVSSAAKYNLSSGSSYDLTANFTELGFTDSPSSSIYTGGRLTLKPNHDGGTWDFDSDYLSRDGNTFTGLKAGKTQIKYTWGEETAAFDVTIKESSLPQTGQDFTLVYLLLAGAAIAAAGALIITRHRKISVGSIK